MIMNNIFHKIHNNFKRINASLPLLVILTLIASIPRIIFATNSLDGDEADYVFAMMKGFWANYFDTNFTRELRHIHPPLLIYLISLSTRLGGYSEFFIRLPCIVFGVANCLLLYFGSLIIFDKQQKLIGFMSSFLLAIMPLHIEASKLAVWHGISSFLSTLILISLIYSLKKNKDIYLFITFLVLGVLFATFEYGFIVCFALITSLILVQNPWINRKDPVASMIVLSLCLLSSLMVLFFFWPGGIIKLDVLKNLIFFLRYAQHGHPVLFLGKITQHPPWWIYIYWFVKYYPLFLLLFLGVLVYLAYLLFSKRLVKHLSPIPIFLIIFLFAMFRQHIIQPIYSLHTIPIFCLLGGMFITHILSTNFIYQKLLIVIFLLSLTITSIISVLHTKDNDTHLKNASHFLKSAASPNDIILSCYSNVMKYYLPNHRIKGLFKIDTSLLNDIKSHKFKFIVFFKNHLEWWPNDPGYEFVKKEFTSVKKYLSNNKVVLEIFEDPEYK